MCQSHIGGRNLDIISSPNFIQFSILMVLEATVFRRYDSSDSNISSLKKGIPTESVG
jgi:hypothetical protein